MSEDAPQFDESQRIEDPEKARAMAEAEAPHRASEAYHMEQATLEANRDDHDAAYENLKWAGDDEALAKKASEEAGRQYDAEKTATQIPVTEGSDPYPDREQDPEKARYMAIHGNKARRLAARRRQLGYENNDPVMFEGAKTKDAEADKLEEEAGRQYDATQSATPISVSETDSNPYPDRVEDAEKAHVMAIAGDRARTNAANLRKRAKNEDSSFFEENALNNAEASDASAEEIEYWASLLHDNPPSQEYLMAHGLESKDVTPEALARLDYEIWVDTDNARESFNNANEMLKPESHSLDELKEIFEGMSETKILELYGENWEERFSHVADAIRGMDEALKQGAPMEKLVELFRLFYLGETNHFLTKAHEKAQLINDVKSGHVSTAFLEKSEGGYKVQYEPKGFH